MVAEITYTEAEFDLNNSSNLITEQVTDAAILCIDGPVDPSGSEWTVTSRPTLMARNPRVLSNVSMFHS